jgi:hypothetical protein
MLEARNWLFASTTFREISAPSLLETLSIGALMLTWLAEKTRATCSSVRAIAETPRAISPITSIDDASYSTATIRLPLTTTGFVFACVDGLTFVDVGLLVFAIHLSPLN